MANIKSYPNNQSVYIGAEEVMKWHHGRSSGVFAAGTNAAVAAVSGLMAVTVSDGLGWMSNASGDGIAWWNDTESTTGSKLQLSIDAADGVLDRIDRIIVEWKTTNYVDYPEIKVLKGTASSTAVAPSLTNSSTLRQISLAKIAVSAGTTAITSAMITDERLDGAVCGLVTEAVTADTSVINAQFQTFLAAIENEYKNLQEGTAVELKKLMFTNQTVVAGAFTADSTYADFPYRAAIPLTNVLSTMYPEVIFNVAEAMGGTFAPVSQTYNGGVYIYASEVPSSSITIPTIIVWKP